MKASEMANEELAECIESARLAPAKYVREDELNFHREAIREAAARLRNLGEIGEEVGLEAIREKSSRVGNAAKMREALGEIVRDTKSDFYTTAISKAQRIVEELAKVSDGHWEVICDGPEAYLCTAGDLKVQCAIGRCRAIAEEGSGNGK